VIESKQHGHLLEFNAKTHRYYLTKKGEEKRWPLVSVTTTNRAFPMAEGLIQWRIKQGVEEAIAGQIMKRAGNIGTICHELFRKIEAGEKPNIPKIPEIENPIRLFNKWRQNVGEKDKVLMAEQFMCSPKLMLAGTMDRLAQRDNMMGLFDWKTSNSIYEAAFFQLAGYDILLKEWFNIKADFWEVIRFGKEDSKYEVKRVQEPEVMEDYRQQFLRNLGTHRWMAKYKS